MAAIYWKEKKSTNSFPRADESPCSREEKALQFFPRCDYNLCRPCYEGNLVFEALEDVEEDVECGAAAAALTLVPEDAEAGEEPPAFCVIKKEMEASSSQ